MAEKTETETEKDPFEGVIFEGEEDAGTPAPGGDEGDGDERLGEREGIAAHEGPAGETDDAKRERRRKERQDKKRLQRETRDENKALKAEMARLARELEGLKGGIEGRVGEVERRAVANDIASINNRLDTLRRVYKNAEVAREKAMTEGNGVEFNRMDQSMRDADAEWRQLHARKAEIERAPQREQVQETERPNPRVARYANDFVSEFPDYDPNGRDADSKVVQALDEAVMEEGFDPATPEYWDELRERVLDRIPEWGGKPQRTNGKTQTNGRPRPRQTFAGGGGGDGGGEGGGYKISADRVAAMKEAGIWDDPKKRARAVERYKAWDRENGQRRSA